MNMKMLWSGAGLLVVGVLVVAKELTFTSPVAAATSTAVFSSDDLSYRSPTEVLGVSVAGDSPASPWYYPSNIATVTSQVYNWLSHATAVKAQIPKSNVGVVMDYAGPSQLSFTDEMGHHILVYPAYYLADAHKNAYGGPIVKRFPYPGILAYQDGPKTVYLKSSGLYSWLKEDTWKSEFTMESYTSAQQNAIHAVSASWHWLFENLFPFVPGIAVRDIPHGGPAIVHGHGFVLPGTCATYAKTVGNNIQVTLTETWYNGKEQHSWIFTVNSHDKILSSKQTDDLEPQSWK